jgi:hypothetical protein
MRPEAVRQRGKKGPWLLVPGLMYMNCSDEKTPYLGWRLFVHGCKYPSLIIPCSESSVPFQNRPALHPPQFPFFPPLQYYCTMHTDDINMPKSYFVEHRNMDVAMDIDTDMDMDKKLGHGYGHGNMEINLNMDMDVDLVVNVDVDVDVNFEMVTAMDTEMNMDIDTDMDVDMDMDMDMKTDKDMDIAMVWKIDMTIQMNKKMYFGFNGLGYPIKFVEISDYQKIE